ncbi:Uncharacterized protein SCP_0900290 [Sparassis crispa]|uniref:Peptidase S54 rhomboid domain-containing protein n=1 Tax=Sparassis crispa TaxID=139825 RepID=A0A401GVC4_9APHY|nr:Uncharacterized protein SCP_0900290 [Sparassis crispa]GBE86152.1 Uncharacterized protein SCP_0900290 [Sparassis crispa]
MLWTLRAYPLRFCIPQTRRSLSACPSRRFPRITSHHVRPYRAPEAPHVPSFREELAKTEVEMLGENTRIPPTVSNQILFFLVGSTLAFGAAARWTNEDTLYWTNKISESSLAYMLRVPTNREMAAARYEHLVQRLKASIVKINESIQGWPQSLKSLTIYTVVEGANEALRASEGWRVCAGIAAVNGLVWMAWAIPPLQTFMMRSFTHHPLSGRSYTMLTSVFSHHGFIHLLFNCMALTSFGSAATSYFGKQQQKDPSNLRESTPIYHFLAFYVSAGIFASLASHVAASRILYPRLVAAAAAAIPISAAKAGKVAAKKIFPSLGASGAVYAAVVVTALAFPNNSVALIFLPGLHFPILWGVGGMVVMDVMGVLRGWALFDHYAHLGGAAFGALYFMYGPSVWESFRMMTLGSMPRSLSGTARKQS